MLYTHLEKAAGLALPADFLSNGPKKQKQKSCCKTARAAHGPSGGLHGPVSARAGRDAGRQ